MRTLVINFYRRACLSIAALFVVGSSQAANSTEYKFPATNQTITWTWQEDRQTGKFCNGDCWVVGPITLTGVTRPNNSATKDGSMYGPVSMASWGEQGFDMGPQSWDGTKWINQNLFYNASLNIANSLPLAVPVNKSIISSITHNPVSATQQLDYQAILTILPSAPPAGSFRPFYGGNDKSIKHNKSGIDYSKFQRLPHVNNMPTFSYLEGLFRHPIINLGNDYKANEYFVAKYNSPFGTGGYGADIAAVTAQAGLMLNMDYPDSAKEALAISYIQYGLDTYGSIVAGAAYPGNGGHSQGRKLPMVVAAGILNDSAMKAKCAETGASPPSIATRFGEDQQTFYVSQNDINTPRLKGSSYQIDPYPQSSLGMAEWSPGGGTPDYTGGYPNNACGYNWSRTYRFNCYPYHVGTALTVKLMGLEPVWNHPAFFDYCFLHMWPNERYSAFANSRYVGQSTAGLPVPDKFSKIPLYTQNMMIAYYGGSPPPNPTVGTPEANPPAGSYNQAQSVVLTSYTTGATIYYTTNGTTPTTSSNLYSSPIPVSANTTLKAIATKSGLSNSGVSTHSYSITDPDDPGAGAVSLSTWPGTTAAITPAQAGDFTISVKATPSSTMIDAQVALSQGLASGYAALAIIGRFNSSGRIDANNNNPYTAKNVLLYSPGTTYTFEFTVNMAAKTYDLKVTPEGGNPTVIAENYAFRTSAPSAQLTHVVVHHDASSAGTISLGDIEIGSSVNRPSRPEGLRVVK